MEDTGYCAVISNLVFESMPKANKDCKQVVASKQSAKTPVGPDEVNALCLATSDASENSAGVLSSCSDFLNADAIGDVSSDFDISTTCRFSTAQATAVAGEVNLRLTQVQNDGLKGFLKAMAVALSGDSTSESESIVNTTLTSTLLNQMVSNYHTQQGISISTGLANSTKNETIKRYAQLKAFQDALFPNKKITTALKTVVANREKKKGIAGAIEKVLSPAMLPLIAVGLVFVLGLIFVLLSKDSAPAAAAPWPTAAPSVIVMKS